jgi:hypothetical protein
MSSDPPPFDAVRLDEARRAAVELFRMVGRPSATPGWKFQDMIGPSQLFHEIGYQHTDDDQEAFKLMANRLAEIADANPSLTILASNFTFLPSEQILYTWMARWADQGFPVIEVGHRLAASLMATSIHDTSSVIPPWKAFAIRVPPGVLTLTDGKGNHEPVSKIMAQTLVTKDGKLVWNYMIQTQTTLTLWRHGVPHDEIADMDPQEGGIQWGDNNLLHGLAVPATAHDDRVNVMAVRLLLGTCLTMSDPAHVKRIPPGKGKGRSRSTAAKNLPNLDRYRLCRPVEVDVRDAVAEYLAGTRKGGAPTVRSLVRGHWRRQACGPHHSERKWVHVEPYWRGPDGAPIAVRDHKVGD